MAKYRYYAVKKGHQTGIFQDWAACQEAFRGYSGAEYKGFRTLEEAREYLGEALMEKDVPGASLPDAEGSLDVPGGVSDPQEDIFPEDPDRLLAYVDGSYSEGLQKYSFGCILLTPEKRLLKKSGSGSNPDSLAIRNVAGEMLGAMFAVRWAIVNGYREIEIRYDYAGIEKWVQGDWKTGNELTRKYAEAMNRWKGQIEMKFCKVVAHSKDKYNDMADQLAKEALTETEGIPPIESEKG